MKFFSVLVLVMIFIFGCSGQNPMQCTQQETQCCTESACFNVDMECVEGMAPEFLGCDMNKCMPKWNCVDNQNAANEKHCEQDPDCACGVHVNTGECFAGNRNYVDTSEQCQDFCSFMTPNGPSSKGDKCVNNVCE